MCSAKSAVSASSCVWSGLGRSVGFRRRPTRRWWCWLSPPLPPTDRDRATDRPTDRPTERRKSVVPAPASVFPPARRLVVMFVGAIPLPSLSGPANDSPTDRLKGKDGCRKRLCSVTKSSSLTLQVPSQLANLLYTFHFRYVAHPIL